MAKPRQPVGDLHAEVRDAMRQAAPLPILEPDVEQLLDTTRPGDALFHRAFTDSLDSILREHRGGLNAHTGAIAEALVEVLLERCGWQPYYDQATPASGGHGVDLLMLDPDLERVFAIEVKATLATRGRPRLSRHQIHQMTHDWLDGTGNPGMQTSDLSGPDVYGLVTFVHFPNRTWRTIATPDLTRARPIVSLDQLRTLHWLDTEPTG